MKKALIFLLLIFTCQLFGQTPKPNFLEVIKPFKKIYLDKQQDFAIAYDMGQHLDKAGIGASIRKTDTLLLQSDKGFIGKEFRIENIDNQLYISSLTEKKSKKYKLEKVENIELTLYNLNNAYYLDQYFAMTDRLNKKYDLNHHDFRNGFYNWKTLTNQKIDQQDFRNFVDREIQETEDSITNRQETLTKQTKYLIDNVEKLDYKDFKDSLSKIPAEYAYQSSYYKTVVNKISKSKPNYVVSLYNDFPENRTLIEFAIENDKALKKRLKTELKTAETNLSKKK